MSDLARTRTPLKLLTGAFLCVLAALGAGRADAADAMDGTLHIERNIDLQRPQKEAPAQQNPAPVPPQTKGVVQLDRIVAVVNDEVITQFELDDRMSRVVQQLQQQGTPLPPPEVLKKQLLERMIADQVQFQYAAQTGLRIDDAQLERALLRIGQENKLGMDEFRAALERDGIKFAKFREEVRNEMTLARLREREVDNRVSVADSEIDNYLNSRAGQAAKEDEYNLAHILIQIPEQATAEQIQARRAQAEQALAQIRGGADFGQLAAGVSDAPDALQGGVIGWKAAGQLPTLFAEALAGLQPGQASDILRSPAGFHLLKLLARRGGETTLIVQQLHARHILIKTNELVLDADARNRLLQLKERIDNGADFAELARQHSDDASAAKGGDLGWLSPGDTVPEFERAMKQLRPGQTSAPVQSPFGWHLIQVPERRDQDVTRERQRLQARQALQDRKADEAYQEWLRQLRDRAYVEYRLED
jgi:peptidyl-prolyl cis-trans isomerase SurA